MEQSAFLYFLYEGFVRPLLFFVDPSRRIFLIYLLSAYLIGVVVFLLHGYTLRRAIHGVFVWEHWTNNSARVDYLLFVFCNVLKAICVLPLLALGSTLAYGLSETMTYCFGPSPWSMSISTVLWLYPLTLFLVKDFFVYVAHYLLHRNKFLWEFHKVHHSATTMTPITLYRMHPVEMVIQNFQGMLAFSTATAVFYYFNHSLLATATILGVNAFSFVFFLAGANLRHSHVPFRYPKILEYIFMSPYQHQLHHDVRPRLCHSNFGSRLALWDTFFGTLVTSDALDPEDRCFGLPDGLYAENDFLGNLYSPFVGNFRYLRSVLRI